MTLPTIQEWAVAIIVLLCFLEVGRRILSFFKPAKRGDDPCANCSGKCSLKHMSDEKQRKCSENLKKKNKKHCG
ncbi:MAG: hypothetical protein LBU37_03620 [Tannerellaceae bacterium]|jgi:hypothetical protein|nr:hypothetical protein [Tannerellaceae bacterium]